MTQKNPPSSPKHIVKTTLALAISTLFISPNTWALSLVQEPPIPKGGSTYVPPNIILSLDDSTSMNTRDMINNTKTRTTVLSEALQAVFGDTNLLPDGSIRFAWQSMGDCTSITYNGRSQKAGTRLSTSAASVNNMPNLMRSLDNNHRNNFVNYAKNFSACTSTPTHFMVEGADSYMRAPLHKFGPWATVPGDTSNKPAEYLGCRRNYHILLTDGGWNGSYAQSWGNYYKINTDPINFDNQDSKNNTNGINTTNGRSTKKYPAFKFPDGKEYNRDNPQTYIYRDIDFPSNNSNWHNDYNNKFISTVADWAFKSWADPLQDPSKLTGSIKLSSEYNNAPDTETFTNKVTGKSVTLEKYWNPNHNPASWPHMTTFTIGFSDAAIPSVQYTPVGKKTKTTDESTQNIGVYNNSELWQKGNYPNPANKYWEAWDALQRPTETLPYGFDGSFAEHALGEYQWFSSRRIDWQGSANCNSTGGSLWVNQPNCTPMEPTSTQQDMWHAALNGRGKFYAVERGEDLKLAFEAIIGKIQEENAPLPETVNASTAASGYNVTQNNAGIFAAGYSPKDGWSGWVKSSAALVPEEVPCDVYDDEIIEDDDDDITPPDTSTQPTTCTRFPSPVNDWGGKTTADRLGEISETGIKQSSGRLILSWNDTTGKAAEFLWHESNNNYMSNSQKDLLGKKNTTGTKAKEKGVNVLNYIRGDRSLEGQDGTPPVYTEAKPFRARYSRQGDIVNSEVWYTKVAATTYNLPGFKSYQTNTADRIPMLYVGGNDGMLHGFSAKDGYEKLAYIPRGAFGLLANLTAPDFNSEHKYFVDGSPMTGDVKTGSGSSASDWSTLLVGTMGAGGKGYFILDVTDPSNFKAGQAANLVVMDKTTCNVEDPKVALPLYQGYCTPTTAEAKDLGNITVKPTRDPSNPLHATQFTRLNNNRWAVILGNGYNSTNQRPVLLVQYLDGAKELLRIQTTDANVGVGNAKDNGLAAPTLVDIDGDGTTDVVYAGDNLGNMWKFNLLGDDASKWLPAFGKDKPLFTARGPINLNGTRNQVQPISAPPIVRANDRKISIDIGGGNTKTKNLGGLMVAFGTGRNITEDDRKSTGQNVQTLYSILDYTSYEIDETTKMLKIKAGDSSCTKTSPTDCTLPPKDLGTLGGTGVNLAEQKFAPLVAADREASKVATTQPLTPTSWANFDGWYIDFITSGERLLQPMQFYTGNILAIYSEKPAGISPSEGSNEILESCNGELVSTFSGKQYRTLLSIQDATAPAYPMIDYDGDGIFDEDIVRVEVPVGTPLLTTTTGGLGSDKTGNGDELLNKLFQPERPQWRQLQ